MDEKISPQLEHSIFKEKVYTHLSDALKLLESRRSDKELVKKVETLLGDDIPDILQKKPCGVLFRQIATPNKESGRFLSITRHNNLHSVFFEYFEDKFTSNNEFKHSLAKLKVYFGLNKNKEHIKKHLSIFDITNNDGKMFKDIKTFSDEDLASVHKRMFKRYNDESQITFFEASNWCHEHGFSAIEYYKNFLMLFICHGILFENFLLSGKEGIFTKEVVLPAIEAVEKMTGFKPLIVPLVPFDIEEDESWYWLHHDVVDETKLKFNLNNK